MKSKSKKKWLATAAALAAVAAMAGTFAWFQSKDDVTNSFVGEIAGNDIEIVEEFEPPTTWPVGTKVNKDVAVKNSGKYDSFIRVSLSETVQKLADSNAKLGDSKTTLTEDAFLFELTKKDFAGYTASTIKNPDKLTIANNKQESGKFNGSYTLKAMEKVTTAADNTKKYEYISFWEKDSDANVKLYARTGGFKRATDSSITPNKTAQFQYVNLTYATANKVDWTKPTPHTPVIQSDVNGSTMIISAADENIIIEFANLEKTAKEGKWTYNQEDGQFYYIGIVAPETQTAQLIDSVTLSSKADNKYSKIKYDLDVHATGIQAIKEAIDGDQWLKSTSKQNISPALNNLKGLKDGNGKVNP